MSKQIGWSQGGRYGRRLGSVLLWIGLLLLTAWTVMALWLLVDLSPLLRLAVVSAAVAGLLLPALLIRPRWRAWMVVTLVAVVVIGWFLSRPATNDRDWQDDLAVLPWAEIKGQTVVVHNIRNCAYRTETDFTCRYDERTYDLAKLTDIDLFLVYWGSPLIAHTMLSFGFGSGGQICFSIETRKEKGEDYSALKGFFRQYEKIYIVADERDVVRLRTNYRHEDVYLYRLKVKPEVVRQVFLDYLAEVNRLKDQPEWYNALTGNCTTSIRQHTKPYNPQARLDWRMIVNGFIDEMIYERGVLDTAIPFAELKKQSYINKKAQSADQAEDFSAQIRAGLPQLQP